MGHLRNEPERPAEAGPAPKLRSGVLLLLNSTKLMDLTAPAPPRTRGRVPDLQDAAAELVAGLRALSARRWRTVMEVEGRLADTARADLARWGERGNPRRPAWFAFTGLLYQGLDPRSLDAAARRRARRRLRILSGLYGLLGPYDLVEAYRLEMGCRWAPGGARDVAAHWRPRLTAALAELLRPGETALSVASQEYLRAVDAESLPGPVVTPVFKEVRPDGSLKTVPVHAKRARGAILRHALSTGARRPRDLLGFHAHGWEAADQPPVSGRWLFTRPARD